MWVTGRSNCPKAQHSWALKAKFKGQQLGVRTMAKALSFEMKRMVTLKRMSQSKLCYHQHVTYLKKRNQSDSISIHSLFQSSCPPCDRDCLCLF
jgi:hypothetical protein